MNIGWTKTIMTVGLLIAGCAEIVSAPAPAPQEVSQEPMDGADPGKVAGEGNGVRRRRSPTLGKGKRSSSQKRRRKPGAKAAQNTKPGSETRTRRGPRKRRSA
jgi:hypothetical protein